MFNDYVVIGGLSVVLFLTLILPFSVKKIEEELEIFLFIMGVLAVTISNQWSMHLLGESVKEPVMISSAVLVVGFIFRRVRRYMKGWMNRLLSAFGMRKTIFIISLFLGLGSSVLTAIIAALILSEVVSILKTDKNSEIRIVVYACFSIGLGAALTPIGEPLSTIVVSKLKGEPYNAGFFFLLKNAGLWIVPGVILSSLMAALSAKKSIKEDNTLEEDEVETNKTIVIRALKIYAFVMALIFLGSGLKPISEKYIAKMPTAALYWVNTISAILDNATLASAEVVPSMHLDQIVFLLMGLLISGGMLIPGNIPNIVSASKLNIKSKQWARIALPFGAAMMVVYFAVMWFVLET